MAYMIDVESLINDAPRAMIIYIRNGDDVVMVDIDSEKLTLIK